MKSPIKLPSVGAEAMKSKFNPVRTPRKEAGLGGFKLAKGGYVKKSGKASGRGK